MCCFFLITGPPLCTCYFLMTSHHSEWVLLFSHDRGHHSICVCVAQVVPATGICVPGQAQHTVYTNMHVLTVEYCP